MGLFDFFKKNKNNKDDIEENNLENNGFDILSSGDENEINLNGVEESEKAKAEAEAEAEAERIAKEEAEKEKAERIAKEESEKAEAERIAKEEAEKEKAEAERIAKEKAEVEAEAEAERIAKEEAEKEKAEAERIAKEKAEVEAEAEAERIAKEEAEKAEAEAERIAKEEVEKAEAERIAKEEAEKAEAERIAKEEAEKAEAEAERIAKEKAEKAEAERIAKEKEEAEKAEAEKAEAEAEKSKKKGLFAKLKGDKSEEYNANDLENYENNTEEVVQEVENVEEKPKKKGFFSKLKQGLEKTRKSILGGVDTVLGSFTKIDEDLFEELEETLIMSDMGVDTTMTIVDNLRKRVKKEHTTDPMEIKSMLIDEISNILVDDEEENLKDPSVLLVIGVNGVGKTTTIGKLGAKFKAEGKTVLMAAADTFRAAAIEQLEIWGERSDITVVKQGENSDPAAVVFDATTKARNEKYQLLICDTAGRLHNKKNLMEELKKISKVIDREHPNAHRETYLVLDATTGQNALQQAKTFKEVAEITGIVLTKLDGTAKGGIVVAIKNELNIPVRYIGVGEGIDDLQKFSASDFAKALFGE